MREPRPYRYSSYPDKRRLAQLVPELPATSISGLLHLIRQSQREELVLDKGVVVGGGLRRGMQWPDGAAQEVEKWIAALAR
jgi:hypothetical protein